MIEAIFVQGFFKLTVALLGVVLGRLTLKWFDSTLNTQSNFGKWLEEADDHAKAIYYAGRVVGVMLVVGLALS